MGEALLQLAEVHDGTEVTGWFPVGDGAAVNATGEPSVLVGFGDYVVVASESGIPIQEAWPIIRGNENLLLSDKTRESRDSASAELMKQLGALRSLKPGWDSYDAPPPHQQAIESARDFLGSVLASESAPAPARVCASVEGGVGIVFQRDSRYADVEFLNDGSIVGGASDGGGPVEVTEWRYTDVDDKEMLDWISERL